MHYVASQFRFVWVFALLATFAVIGEARAAERLAWKLKTDDRLAVTTTQTITTNTTYTGNSVESTLHLTVESQWHVTGVSDGVIDLTQKVTRARVEMQTPKSDPIVFDSADEKRASGPARQLQSAVQPLIGLTVKLKLYDRGEVLSAELPELPETAKAAPNSRTSTVSPETLKALLSKPIAVLPEGEVEIGATWKEQSTSKSPVGEVQTEKTYKLLSVEEIDSQKIATIEAEGTIRVAPKGKLKVADSQFSQTVLFNVEEGLLTSSEQKVQMKTENPYRETTITVDMGMTLKTTIERAK